MKIAMLFSFIKFLSICFISFNSPKFFLSGLLIIIAISFIFLTVMHKLFLYVSPRLLKSILSSVYEEYLSQITLLVYCLITILSKNFLNCQGDTCNELK